MKFFFQIGVKLSELFFLFLKSFVDFFALVAHVIDEMLPLVFSSLPVSTELVFVLGRVLFFQDTLAHAKRDV